MPYTQNTRITFLVLSFDPFAAAIKNVYTKIAISVNFVYFFPQLVGWVDHGWQKIIKLWAWIVLHDGLGSLEVWYASHKFGLLPPATTLLSPSSSGAGLGVQWVQPSQAPEVSPGNWTAGWNGHRRCQAEEKDVCVYIILSWRKQGKNILIIENHQQKDNQQQSWSIFDVSC